MKHQTWLFFAGLLVLTASSLVSAQDVGLKVRIPFSFTIRDRNLSAGEYLVVPIGDRAIRVRPVGAKQPAITVITDLVAGNERPKLGNLVFNCYEDRCFLSQVWINEQYYGRELLRSEIEGQLAAWHHGYRIAVLRFPPRS